MEPEGSRGWTALVAFLRRPRVQLALLGGLLGTVVLVILITDVATGGDTESPPALGAAIDVTPGARTVIVPTLAPIEAPTTAAARCTARTTSAGTSGRTPSCTSTSSTSPTSCRAADTEA